MLPDAPMGGFEVEALRKGIGEVPRRLAEGERDISMID